MFNFGILIISLIISINDCSFSQEKSKTAFFISIPAIGHLNPLLRQAKELYRRHDLEYNIYVISCSNVKQYVETFCFNTTIKFLDLGYCYNETESILMMEKMASEANIRSGGVIGIKWIILHLYPNMYEQMLNVIELNILTKQETIIAIIDFFTYAGADIADHFNIPYIVNNADLLQATGWYDILSSDYNPKNGQNQPSSIHSIGTNLLMRTISPIVRCFATLYIYFVFDRPWNNIRQTKFHLNNTIHLMSRHYSHMTLVNNVFGLEYAQHLPPYVQLTGSMLSTNLSQDYYLTQLSDEDRQWIESDLRPIIYINFGTAVPISDKQIEKIYLAIRSLDKFRIIWKLDRRDLLPAVLPSTIRIVKWISSTLGYLAHSNVHLFISHCGINSVYESIWLGTPIICIPIFGDQLDMAQRIEDFGVGKWLDKLKFTSEQLKEVIEKMLDEEEYSSKQKNIKRIQKIMKIHGGVERAVDLIELVAEYGSDTFIPINNSYPWYAYYDLDVYAIWLLAFIAIKKLITCCYYRSRTIIVTEKAQKMKNL